MTRPAAHLIVLAVLLAALALAMEATTTFEGARQTLRDGFGPEGGQTGRSARILEELGMPSALAGWLGSAADAPSSRAVNPRDLQPGQWLVSIAIPDESLSDPERGIVANRDQRGREWERVGWVTIYDGTRLAFATRAGIRVHGGQVRESLGRPAFRVIFRPSYGLPHLPADGPLHNRVRLPDRFVVRRSQVITHAQPIAFAIARRIGAMAPDSQSVRFVLNGDMRREAYELTEHVSREGWGRAFFGHDDVRFFQFRGTTSEADAAAYYDLGAWVTKTPSPLRLEALAERVDPDLLLRHVFTIMYCGTLDWDQGGAVLNLRSPRPQWFWVHWDLDQSFIAPAREDWVRPSIEIFTNARGRERNDIRARLFARLVREDPSFPRHFMAFATEILNHRLTQDYLQDLAWRHQVLSVREEPFRGVNLSGFFERRGDEVLNAVAEVFRQPLPSYVGIEAPDDVRLDVDGYTHDAPFLGRYFHGQTVTVQAIGGDGRPRTRWNVNGQPSTSDRLEVVVEGETLIRLEG